MTPSWRSRSRAIAAALLAAAFVAGAAAGIVADRLTSPRPTIRVRQDMSGVLDKLNLTRAQRAQAEAILQRRTPLSEDAMREVAERLRAVADSVDAELRAILSPAQRVRLDSLRPRTLLMLKRKTPDNLTTVDTVLRRSSGGNR
jgi:hypothetical protein